MNMLRYPAAVMACVLAGVGAPALAQAGPGSSDAGAASMEDTVEDKAPAAQTPADKPADMENKGPMPAPKSTGKPAEKLAPFPLPVAADSNPYGADGKIDEMRFDVHSIRLINIPMKILPPSLDQKSDPLWVKGKRPKKNLLVKAHMVPRKAALAEITDSNGMKHTITLMKARAHIGYPPSKKAPETLRKMGAIYCGSNLAKPGDMRIFCLEDVDGDKRFDRIGQALSDNLIPQPADVAAMQQPANLITPLPYTQVAEENLPRTDIEWRNCGRDWDKPYFSIGLATGLKQREVEPLNLDLLLRAADPSALSPAELSRVMAMMNLGRNVSAVCQRGYEIDGFNGITPKNLEKKSILVDLDSMIFSVGPKKKGAAVKLLGYRDDGTLYQMEGSAIRNLQHGLSKQQKKVATAQLFDRPTFMSDGKIQITSAPVKQGEILLRMGFAHGYLAKLTRKTKIRTLFSSRSLDAGTLLYGIPMRSSITRTINGIPQGAFGRSSQDERQINARLVWCVPVRDEKKILDDSGEKYFTRIEWSATCIPDRGGSYTILKGQKPAFTLSSMRFNAETKSNDGSPPVERVEEGDFGGELEFRYRAGETNERGLKMIRETWFGEEKVEEKPTFVRMKDGMGTMTTAEGKFEIRNTEGDAGYNIEMIEAVKPGKELNLSF